MDQSKFTHHLSAEEQRHLAVATAVVSLFHDNPFEGQVNVMDKVAVELFKNYSHALAFYEETFSPN
jgi:hypothetical protein